MVARVDLLFVDYFLIEIKRHSLIMRVISLLLGNLLSQLLKLCLKIRVCLVSLLDLVLKLGYLLGTLLVRVHFKLELS